MIILGITGGIGSGKSTISELLLILGIPVYIADLESKKLTNNSSIIRKELIKLYGKDIYNDDGLLNKIKLASIIFNDKKQLQKVNAIIHPEVKENLCEWLVNNKENDIVAYESAIMFESGFHKLTNKILTVYTPLEIRVNRIIKRDNSSREKALERIKSQMDDEERIKLSDFVIVNDDTKSLIDQVLETLARLNQELK